MNQCKLKILVLGMVQTNCYIISNEATKEAIVFDPADNAEKIEQYFKANDLVCKGILLTHGHFDHILAARALAQSLNTKILAHEAEAELLKDSNLNASYYMHRECSLVPDVLLRDGELLMLAGLTLQVLHTPGHTAGGVCYLLQEHNFDNKASHQSDTVSFPGKGALISGDTLFLESIGRTDLPTGNGKLLVESIKSKLMLLEDEVVVYPGHGRPTTIGYERNNNAYLTDSWESF